MEQLEKVEKLREKTGVTYEEAKAALEACEWDLLDAIVYLESQGKIKDAGMASYTTKSESSEEFKQAAKDYEDNSNRVTLGEMVDKFLKWCGKIIKKGCDNYFEVYKDGKIVINAPVQEDEVSYSVQDEGVGMAESEIVHVFERFYRSDSARNSKTGGTGLGLSIAKWIVDAHGGVIEILSKPDMGTRFAVKFSIKKLQKS